MSTSLAAQLQKLAVPSTNVLKDTKKRSTLIFDPKEAASISTEVIYEIAIEGLEKLIQKNDEFAQFKTSLFHASSRDFDRNVQTKFDNKKLDDKIKKFLLLLAPYVLMNPAHKALEWLYFRYRVNEYNRDELILLVLPYYSSNIFLRLVQTLKFKKTSDPFYFLHVTKSGAHLQRLDLFYQALSNHGIIKSLNKYLSHLIETHSNYSLLQNHFSFYSTVFCGAIELANEITDSFVSQLIPLVLKGLNSSIPDFAAGSHIIVARLLSKGTLSNKLLNCIVEKAADLKCSSLKLEASLLLILTYQLQEQYKVLSDQCLSKCSTWIGPCLGYLYANGNSVRPFLAAVIKKAVLEENDGAGRKLLWTYVKEVTADVTFIQEILSLLLDVLDEETASDSETNQWAASLIKHFEKTNQPDLDFAVGSILRERDLSDYKRTFLETVSSNFAANLKVLDDLDWDITEEALNDLERKGKYVLTDALLKKLKEKDPKVVENCLKLILRIDWGDVDTLKYGVRGLFSSNKILFENWFKSYILAAEFLLKNQDFTWDLCLTLTPFILTFYKKHSDEINNLFRVQTSKSQETFFIHLMENLNIEKLSLCLMIQPTSTNLFSALYILSLKSTNISASDVPEILKIFDIVAQKGISKEPAETLEAQLQIALNKKLPIKLIEKCFRKLWTLYPKDLGIILKVCSVALNKKRVITLFSTFLNETASDPTDQLKCCITICTFSSLDDAICLKVLDYILNNLVEDVIVTDIIVLGLLTLFFHTNKEIRQKTFDVAFKLTKIQNDKCKKLLEHIKTFKEEIEMDQEQLPLICFKFFCKHSEILAVLIKACCSDVPIYIKAKILQILSHINNQNIFEKLSKYFLPILDLDAELDCEHVEIILNIISRVDETIAAELNLNSSSWKFIFKVLNIKKSIKNGKDKVYLPNELLKQLSKYIHAISCEKTLEKLLDVICEVTATTEDPEIIVTTSKIFKHMDLETNLIIGPLKKMVEVQSVKPTGARRARNFSLPTADILDTLEWKKGVCMLEFIQGKKKIRNSHLLLPVLFSTLKRCLDFEEQTAVEYPKQLILSALLLVFGKSEEKLFSDKDFNVELVIQCIRASQNPQTHYYALLVLSHAAKFIPDQVLNHIMAVFTFMGTTLVRHDDAYSFDVIGKLIDGIVPVLVDGNHVTTIGDVLRVFVDALLDVPEHRRAPLYLKLLEKTKVKNTFHLFLLLTLEAEVFQTGRDKKKSEKGNLSERIQFALLLCEKFPPNVALHACVEMTEYLKTLPDEKDNMVMDPSLSKFNGKQYRHYKYLIVTFLSKLLCHPPFVNKISFLSSKESILLEQSYKKIIVNILSYIQRVQRISEKSSTGPQGVYWKTVLYHSYDLLDHVNDLLTPHMFLLVITGLLQHSILTVRKKALELLNNKLQINSNWFTIEDEEQLFNILKPLLMIIKKSLEEEDDLQLEQETLVQTALLSLKLVAKRLGSESPERFLPVLEFVAEILNLGKAKDNLLASVILCLAELCVVLRAHGIQALPLFMPSILKVLKAQKFQQTSSMLLLSVLTTVCKLLESFASFLSPYLKKLVVEISILSSKWDVDTADPKTQALIGRLHLIKKRLASVIPSRILLPIIDECYDTLLKKKYFNALVALVDILEEQLKTLKSNELGVVMAEMTQFSLKILQLRSEHSTNMEVANLVEDQTVKTITTFVLKLSESSFRPFYLKLYDWAVRTPGSNRERQITFYHLSESIGRSLKGLFVLFAGTILSNLAEILRDAAILFEDSSKSILLLTYALRTLEVVFTYDNKKLINRDNFELLMQPMVDLLETDLDGIDNLVKRAETLIIPTIVQFSVAVADDTLWKEMNYQILLKMRNSKPDIRLVALECLGEVVGKLREDFLPLLPETIPFLAELLEDEDERVEKTCQKTIREMEKVLGEPLQKYF